MKNNLLYLLDKLLFTVLFFTAMILAVVPVFIDILFLDNTVGEESLTEFVQEIVLLIIVAYYIVIAKKYPDFRHANILIAGFFGCIFVREMDMWLDRTFHGFWFYVALCVAIFCVLYAMLSFKKTVQGLVDYTSRKSFVGVICGLGIVLFFSRFFGMGLLWENLLAGSYLRIVKNTVEEGSELLGYCICLASTLYYYFLLAQERGNKSNAFLRMIAAQPPKG